MAWRSVDEVREMPQSVLREVGTVNHCMHGAHANIEEVTDWRPLDYLTLTTLLPMPGAPKIALTYALLENAGDGAHRNSRGQAQVQRQSIPRAGRAGIPEDHRQRDRDPPDDDRGIAGHPRCRRTRSTRIRSAFPDPARSRPLTCQS
jgi:hypothetical protein